MIQSYVLSYYGGDPRSWHLQLLSASSLGTVLRIIWFPVAGNKWLINVDCSWKCRVLDFYTKLIRPAYPLLAAS